MVVNHLLRDIDVDHDIDYHYISVDVDKYTLVGVMDMRGRGSDLKEVVKTLSKSEIELYESVRKVEGFLNEKR
jgi:hypothetical protein